ncbi:RNA polymerase sigma-E factor [hydrothermal vent metagenome]|uniref:RNA polymerase sigma-E factor n=1 Tax=hydrothermal vent metagenome TaxID=652676 RepID=A0A3B0TJW4_9ZZZZ
MTQDYEIEPEMPMNTSAGDHSDFDLVSRIAGGDRAAIRLLFHRHHARIYRFVMRQTGSETMADDIANEVFLELWRQADKFEGRSQVSTWLMGIARFKVLSARRKRTEARLDDDFAAGIADDGDTPEVSELKRDKAAGLRRLIDKLSEPHRLVIDLAYYHGKSVTQIGEILDIPAATVKTRMFYARKTLGAALAEAGMDRGWP